MGSRPPPAPRPGPPPPCGMQNVLCRFRCETSAPNLPGRGQPDQRVQVRAVHVDLAAGRVHLIADVGHGLLEDAVRGRVGEHDRRHLPGMCGQLGPQVGQVDGAVPAALDHYHPQACEHRAGGVRAVRGLRDQAHVPPGFAAARCDSRGWPAGPASSPWDPAFGCSETASYPVISASHASSSADQLAVPAGLLRRREGMKVSELRPGNGLHLRRRVEFQCARAQRDHRPVQGDVEVGQPTQVAQHRRLAAVLMEDRVGEVGGGAPQGRGNQVLPRRQLHLPGRVARQRGRDLAQMRVGGGLVTGDLHGVLAGQV